MFRRSVTLPAGPESVWRAITDPGAVADWFGASVEWDLRPGGRAHFRPVTGGDRDGVIDDVEPGRALRFRWWPADGDGDVSEISYDLEPDDDGTTLTVTERRLPVAVDAAGPSPTPVQACAAAGPGAWTGADQAQWEHWAASSTRPGLLLAVGLAR